jgi:THO complex subunit 1
LCRYAAGAQRVPVMAFTGGGGGKKGGALPTLPRLLDLTLFISEQGICDGGVIFTVLEQLVEACTIGGGLRKLTQFESS